MCQVSYMIKLTRFEPEKEGARSSGAERSSSGADIVIESSCAEESKDQRQLQGVLKSIRVGPRVEWFLIECFHGLYVMV